MDHMPGDYWEECSQPQFNASRNPTWQLYPQVWDSVWDLGHIDWFYSKEMKLFIVILDQAMLDFSGL